MISNPVFLRVLIYSILLGVIGIMLHLLAKHMTYPAPDLPLPANPPSPWTRVTVPHESDPVLCWLAEPSNLDAKAPLLVFFHGNGENLATLAMSGTLDALLRLRAHVMVVEFPGYDQRGTSASEASLTRAGTAAATWFQAQHPNCPLILAGWSLGAGVAVACAPRLPFAPQRLILLSPWTSLRDVAAAHFPRFLVALVLRERYPSKETAAQIHCPVLIIHGEEDLVIPFSQGEILSRCFPGEVSFVPVPDGGHNDILSRPMVWNAIASFVQTGGS